LADHNIFTIDEKHCNKLKIQNPVISKEDLDKIKTYSDKGFKATSVPMLYNINRGLNGLEDALDKMLKEVSDEVDNGSNIIILSDRNVSKHKAPIPALLACSYVNSGLQKLGKRSKVSIIIESAEPREVHHFALLFGYGAVSLP